MNLWNPQKLDKPLFEIIPDSVVKAGNNGYYYCQTDPPYPSFRAEKRPDRKAHYVYYHRAVFERSYGYLPKGYQVDHKDGNKENNKLSNLKAVPNGPHQKSHAERGNHFWKHSPRTHKRKASDHLRRIAKCLCQITDVGKLPAVDQIHGTIILDRNCPDHKNIGRDGGHSERDTETSIKPKMAPEKRVASQYLSEVIAESTEWPEEDKNVPENRIKTEFKKSGPFYKILNTHIHSGDYVRTKDIEELKYLHDTGYFPSEQEAVAMKDKPESLSTYTIYFNTYIPLEKDVAELIDAKEVSKEEIDKLPPSRYSSKGHLITRGRRIQ
jgi:hypothetical protein